MVGNIMLIPFQWYMEFHLTPYKWGDMNFFIWQPNQKIEVDTTSLYKSALKVGIELIFSWDLSCSQGVLWRNEGMWCCHLHYFEVVMFSWVDIVVSGCCHQWIFFQWMLPLVDVVFNGCCCEWMLLSMDVVINGCYHRRLHSRNEAMRLSMVLRIVYGIKN